MKNGKECERLGKNRKGICLPERVYVALQVIIRKTERALYSVMEHKEKNEFD